MWACVAVGQVPGDVTGAFAPLLSLIVYKLECGVASLPSLFLDLLWILFIADGDIALAFDIGNFAVVALGAFGDTGDSFLYFSRNGIVGFSTTVPGSIEMGFEVAYAFSYWFYR